LSQAKRILPTIPVPSLMSHMRVAARGVEVLLPTPTPSSTALVANEPERLLAKAWKIIVHGNIYLRLNYRFFLCLNGIPDLVGEVIFTHRIRVALG